MNTCSVFFLYLFKKWSEKLEIYILDQSSFMLYSSVVTICKNQSHYRPDVPRGFQEVKVPRLRDNGTGW